MKEKLILPIKESPPPVTIGLNLREKVTSPIPRLVGLSFEEPSSTPTAQKQEHKLCVARDLAHRLDELYKEELDLRKTHFASLEHKLRYCLTYASLRVDTC